jgi:hypothetical protein
MTMEADRSAVAKARQAWTKAMLEGDLTSLRALYTDDVVVLPMDERPIVGRQAVDEWYRGVSPEPEARRLGHSGRQFGVDRRRRPCAGLWYGDSCFAERCTHSHGLQIRRSLAQAT